MSEKPPRFQARLKASPRIRELVWCDFPQDAQLPEFWKKRPVIILSHRNTLSGTVTIVPCSSSEQNENPWAVKLRTTIDGSESWAICDKFSTFAVSRLSPRKEGRRRLPEDEFNLVLSKVLEWLPKLPEDRGNFP